MMDVRQCAKCRALKPLTEFDQRFVSKPGRVTCASCRGMRSSEADKWQVAWETRRANERRMLEWVTERDRKIEELAQREEEQERRREVWRQQLLAQGYTADDVRIIENIHWRLMVQRGAGASWSELKVRFHALQPPYIGAQARPKVSDAVRDAVYSRQAGRCFYCDRELLPRDVWTPGKRRELDRGLWHNAADSGIPELDHRMPLARGGSHTLDNLCYACRRCNQRKYIRTQEEFIAMPHDAISALECCGLTAGVIAQGIRLEAQGYSGFLNGTTLP